MDKHITKDDVVQFAVSRVEIAASSCNSFHINCVSEQIRGAIWLFTGEDPCKIMNSIDIFEALDVPYKVVENTVYWGDEVKNTPV